MNADVKKLLEGKDDATVAAFEALSAARDHVTMWCLNGTPPSGGWAQLAKDLRFCAAAAELRAAMSDPAKDG